MRKRRIVIAAAAAVLAAAAALGGYLWPRHPASRPVPDEARATAVSDRYRREAVSRMPDAVRYADSVRGYVACPGTPGRYLLSSRFDLATVPGATATAFANLRGYWRGQGYRVVNDVPGLNGQLLVENPADGFRIGISERATRYVRLAISSPCLAPAVAPVSPVLPQDMAIARAGYERYVSGQLSQLTAQVGDLRVAIAAGEPVRARTAWLTAQLTWERVGAAYGSFGDLADAIDGLPQGLPGGVADPGFTGLHRVEYGLWHGESGASLLGVVDRLAADVGRLAATLPQVAPDQGDLPLRVHEVLEDALRDHLTGSTDQGGGAGLAETSADVDATRALLDVFAPLIDARRPALLGTARTGLDTVQQALERCRTGGGWPAPAALDPTTRGGIEAALGAVLETLAGIPGLLEVTGS